MRGLIRRFPTTSFFILAYAVSWAYWIPMLVTGQRVAPGSTTTHFPGLPGPRSPRYCSGVSELPAARIGAAQYWFPPGRFWRYSLSPVGSSCSA
jgi:hypothetical protein